MGAHILPFLQGICGKYYFFFKLLIALLKLTKMLFALSLVHEDIVRLVLVFLMVGGFKVILLSIVFLKVELFF